MNMKNSSYVVAAIAAAASACMQQGWAGDEQVAARQVVASSEQPDELMATGEAASGRMTESGEAQPATCPLPDPCQPVDVPTNIPCNLTTDCPTNHYCHPYTRVCNNADGEQCQRSEQCAGFGDQFYCHDRRCHPLAGDACSANTCPSGQYCHVGICHADACSTNADCPEGLLCSPSRHVCRIP
jgi:hypothetical protein